MNLKKVSVILLASLCSMLHSSENGTISPEYLLQNPIDFVQNNKEIQKSFKQEWDALVDQSALNKQKFMKEAVAIAQKCEQQNPLFLIKECTASTCGLTRSLFNTSRAEFESKASNLLEKLIELFPNDTIKYTDYGSGAGLTSLIIATSILMKKSSAKLDICLIDPEYGPAFEYREKNDQQCAVIPQDLDSLYEHTKNTFQKKLELVADFSPLFTLLLIEMRHRQFISWLTREFPFATLSLNFYQSAQHYLEHNNNSPAHIITTIDTIPSNPTSHDNILLQYQQLCKETYRLNYRLCCISLAQSEVDRNLEIQVMDKSDSVAPSAKI